MESKSTQPGAEGQGVDLDGQVSAENIDWVEAVVVSYNEGRLRLRDVIYTAIKYGRKEQRLRSLHSERGQEKPLKITKEEIEKRGFTLQEYMGGKAYVRRIANETYLRFGGQFNGLLELELPDGNDGQIILVPAIQSWEDIEVLARMFAGIWIDTGHTLTSNMDDDEAPEGAVQGTEGKG